LDAPRPLDGLLALARALAGPDLLALILSGSHARGDAVWAEVEGRKILLSDLDVYAVARDRAAQRAAERRAAAARPGLAARALALGLAAPLEVAILTPQDVAALPARPGTIELRRHGRVVEGDPALLARVPQWSGRDVSPEEILLLLENRAFELLAAQPGADEPGPLAQLRRRHEVLKVALELATVVCLAAGEYPDGAAARVARARTLRAARAPEPPWDAALGWRSGRVEPLPAAAAAAEWRATATAWLAAWRTRVAALDGGACAPASDPYAAVARAARRARLARRARQALTFRARGGAGPTLLERLAVWWRGTPQHRLGAGAAALIIHALEDDPADRAWRRALDRLGLARGRDDPAAAARELVRCWDRWILDGQRSAEAP